MHRFFLVSLRETARGCEILWENVLRLDYDNMEFFDYFRFLTLHSNRLRKTAFSCVRFGSASFFFPFLDLEVLEKEKGGKSEYIQKSEQGICKYNSANIYLFKINKRNSIKRREICSKLTIKTPERPQWPRSSVFVINLENFSHLFLVFLLTLNK